MLQQASRFALRCGSAPRTYGSVFVVRCEISIRVKTSTSNFDMCASRSYHCQEFGTLHHEDYRMFFLQDTKPISPFHDIPLFVDKEGEAVDGNAKTGIFNMVVEIPRWTNTKMEISRDEPLNPIKQDTKKNKPRFVHNVFPHKGYIWNYGAFPQTWEDPEHVTPETGCKGDRDPLDVCEIGHRVAKRGDILQVKSKILSQQSSMVSSSPRMTSYYFKPCASDSVSALSSVKLR